MKLTELTGKLFYECDESPHNKAWEDLSQQSRMKMNAAAKVLEKKLHYEEIVGLLKALTETDTTYETGLGDTECVFCNGDSGYGLIAYRHQEQCPVSIARRILKAQASD